MVEFDKQRKIEVPNELDLHGSDFKEEIIECGMLNDKRY